MACWIGNCSCLRNHLVVLRWSIEGLSSQQAHTYLQRLNNTTFTIFNNYDNIMLN